MDALTAAVLMCIEDKPSTLAGIAEEMARALARAPDDALATAIAEIVGRLRKLGLVETAQS